MHLLPTTEDDQKPIQSDEPALALDLAEATKDLPDAAYKELCLKAQSHGFIDDYTLIQRTWTIKPKNFPRAISSMAGLVISTLVTLYEQ